MSSSLTCPVPYPAPVRTSLPLPPLLKWPAVPLLQISLEFGLPQLWADDCHDCQVRLLPAHSTGSGRIRLSVFPAVCHTPPRQNPHRHPTPEEPNDSTKPTGDVSAVWLNLRASLTMIGTFQQAVHMFGSRSISRLFLRAIYFDKIVCFGLNHDKRIIDSFQIRLRTTIDLDLSSSIF